MLIARTGSQSFEKIRLENPLADAVAGAWGLLFKTSGLLFVGRNIVSDSRRIFIGPAPQPVPHIDMMITSLGGNRVAVAVSGLGADIVNQVLAENP